MATRSRLAQASQAFLYLLTLVIFALILLFGYKMVTSFRARSEDLLLLKFDRDLQATVESVTYGTQKIRTFDVPPGYEAFWLADELHAFDDADVPMDACKSLPPEIKDALTSHTGKNAFLIGSAKFHAFRLEHFSVANGCVRSDVVGNELKLTLSKG